MLPMFYFIDCWLIFSTMFAGMDTETAGGMREARIQGLRIKEERQPSPLQPEHDSSQGNYVSINI